MEGIASNKRRNRSCLQKSGNLHRVSKNLNRRNSRIRKQITAHLEMKKYLYKIRKKSKISNFKMIRLKLQANKAQRENLSLSFLVKFLLQGNIMEILSKFMKTPTIILQL